MIRILNFVALASLSYGFVVQEVPKRSVLSGQALVDHVNAVQDSWKAEYSSISMKAKTMDVRFAEVPESEKSEKSDDLEFETLIQLPTAFDSRVQWPNCNSIKLIRDQTYCGSCWAFAAAEIISDRICIQSNGTQQPIISPEDILSCCGSSCNNGCQGGYTIEAMKYWMNSGVVTGGDYQGAGCIPYSFRPCSTCKEPKDAPSCKTTCQASYKAKSAYRLPTTTSSNAIVANAVQMIQTEIYNNGPVEVAYQVYDDFYHYKSGVYYHVYGDKPSGHAVKIIGWGTEKKVDYWLVANSWSTTFGENGFFKIRRGTNECGIEENVVAGLPKSSGNIIVFPLKMYMVIQFNPDNDVVELKEFLYQGKFRYVETSNLQELYEKYKAIREQAKAEATAPVETDNQKSINEEKIDNQSMNSENSENSKFKIPKNPSKSQECEKGDPIAHTQKLLAALGPRISNFSQKRTIDILREKIGSPKTDSSQPEPSDSLPKMTPKLSNPTIFPIPEPSENRESEKAKNRKRSHRRNSGNAENSKMEDSKVLEILKNLNMPESNSPGFEPIFPLKWTDGY